MVFHSGWHGSCFQNKRRFVLLCNECLKFFKRIDKVEGTITGSINKKRVFSFEKFLFLSFCTAFIILSYETIMQNYYGQASFLGLFHRFGYLESYSIVYEPSKGVWIDLGWTGSFMMMFMMLYSVRKRVSFLRNFGSLKYWLWGHMFLGIMGPVLVTFHTTFKFGGIIATSFWCMIVTMVFGILGRYIYVQIPRSISGTELQVSDIDEGLQSLDSALDEHLGRKSTIGLMSLIDSGTENLESLSPLSALFFMISMDLKNRLRMRTIRKKLKTGFGLKRSARKSVISRIRERNLLLRKKRLLATSHKLLHYWHVLHIPLAIVMFIIMFIHICVHFLFRPLHG